MEIEYFWKNIPSFKTIEKGKDGRIGYGFRYKHKRPYDKMQKRKAYREIKKYGFDLSETWSLDYTIMLWLSDTFGGFFKICGCCDNWAHYDLDGNYIDFWDHKDDKNHYDNMYKYETTRYNSFRKHLNDLLNTNDPKVISKFSEFCSPRLRILAKFSHGWPSGEKYKNYEDWINVIIDMADKFDNGTYSQNFIDDFFCLWD